MSHTQSTSDHPSSMNPIWVEQRCHPPTLPPLSPQYHTYRNQQTVHNRHHSHLVHHHHHRAHHQCTHNTQNVTHPHARSYSNTVNNNNNNNYYHHQQQQASSLTAAATATNAHVITRRMPMIALNPFSAQRTISNISNDSDEKRMINVPSFARNKSISKHKRKCLAMSKEECEEKACLEYRDRVKGWWIGQRIAVETETGDQMLGEIKDYCSSTDCVQIWYDNDSMTFESVKLRNLLNWNVLNTRNINEYSDLSAAEYVASSISYKPLPFDLLQRVSVLYRNGSWYTAFIDGFDPISRRYHINYGDTTQWIWSNKNNIKPLASKKLMAHVEKLRERIANEASYAEPPPWDPEPYGLDDDFAIYSLKMCKEKIIKKDLYFYCKDVLKKVAKQKKEKKKKKKKKRFAHRKRKRNEFEESQHEESSEDEDQANYLQQIPRKPPPPKKKKKNRKQKQREKKHYPRVVSLKGEKWNRSYSVEEKKYFWTNSVSNQSSWNPWNDIMAKNAPWITTGKKWTKFKDDNDKPYWYNYENGDSTYKKPNDYVASDEILADSADDDDDDDDYQFDGDNSNNNNQYEQ